MSNRRQSTRRAFLGAAAATGAAAALPTAADAKKHKAKRRPKARRADVIVVGAGLAGLNAARRVVAKGHSAYVVEARDRVGGRTLNADIGGGHIVERGGQWVGPTQDRLYALAKELGVDTFKTYNDGNGVLVYKGTKQTFSTSGPLGPIPPVPDGLVDAALLIQKLDQMATEIDVRTPWKAAKAVEYDSQTFETWKQANTTTEGGRYLVDLGFTSVFAAEPRDVSLLYTLFYIAAAGNETNVGTFDRLINTAGGAQESRFVGGSQLISIKMAQQLGKRVVLNAPVRSIAQSSTGVTVTTDRGVFKGKQVIVSVPVPLAGEIAYDPVLPFTKAQLFQRMPFGTVIKVQAIYDKPFWRAEGYAGYTNSDTDPVRLTFDNSPPDGSVGVLLGFIEGEAGRRWGTKTPAERRAAVLDNFVTFYGDRARNATDYVEMVWASEAWSRGCYGGFTAPGVLLDYGQYLRAPVGRIKWAGTETADYWVGYMDGALRSGERAAAEALADL